MKIYHPIYKLNILPYQEKDRDGFVDIFMDEELCQHMAGGAFEKEKDAKNLFNHLLKLNKYKETISNSYGVFYEENLIGHFEINQNNFTKIDELEIVYLLIKAYWGKGIMKSLIKHFQDSFKQKLIARVNPNNFNSIKMLEKLGIEKQTLAKFNNANVLKIMLK
jgi:RimJ/RimL family protein N-acetyltransferase